MVKEAFGLSETESSGLEAARTTPEVRVRHVPQSVVGTLVSSSFTSWPGDLVQYNVHEPAAQDVGRPSVRPVSLNSFC